MISYTKKNKVWTAEEVEYIQQIAQEPISLNMIIGNVEGDHITELGDIIEDDSPGPEEITIQNDTRSTLIKFMSTLKPKEQKILMLLHGFYDGVPMTREEVGEIYGVTRERIRQIEQKALKRLRAKIRRKNIQRGDL